MGQKANLQTLRPLLKSINLFTFSPIEFLKGLNFLNYLNSFFNKKGILLINTTLNFIGRKAQISLTFFIRTAKTFKFNRQIRFCRVKKNQNFVNFFANFLFKKLKFLEINTLALKIMIVNRFFSRLKKNRFLQILYFKHRFFKDSLFSRRQNLFFDFLKISYLFSKNIVNSKNFIFILGQIFRFLPKNKHARFFIFVKKIFTVLVEKGVKDGSTNSILGLKFLIAGRLKGKLRKKKHTIQLGKIPSQTISKNIDFGKIDVFTRYGVFGFKLWTYRN